MTNKIYTKFAGRNAINAADCYKFSHPFMVSVNVDEMTSYIEARKGRDIVFFGLQAYIREYLSTPITMEMIDREEKKAKSALLPFHREMWEHVVKVHNGIIPVEIEALPEGTVVPSGVPVVQVTSLDDKYPALAAAIETAILRGIWYPSEVATTSYDIKVLCADYLDRTSDADKDQQLACMLNDFGARGCSSGETAALGGLGHLVNFLGSDTYEAIDAAIDYYDHDLDRDGPVLISVPATEHSVTTVRGEAGESAFIGEVIDTFTEKGFPIISVVADSFDLDRFVSEYIGGDLKDKILARDGWIVVRPDSGVPHEIVPHVVKLLDEKFGSTVNSKGFKVLNQKVRVIQGDGVEWSSIDRILYELMKAGYSAENVVFGMGGKLLQAPMRDDHSWAMKTNEAIVDGKHVDVQKRPKTDMSKASKAGKQSVIHNGERLVSIRREDLRNSSHGARNFLEPVWRMGEWMRVHRFTDVRKNASL